MLGTARAFLTRISNRSILSMSPLALGAVRYTYICLVFSYAASFLVCFEVFRAIESLLIVGFLAFLIVGAKKFPSALALANDPFFGACFLLAVFLGIAGVWHSLTLPDGYSISTKLTRYYLKPVLILPLALGLVLGPQQGRWYFLIAALLGLVGYLAFFSSFGEWQAAWAGQRVDFDIHNAQHASMFFGVLTLGLVIFAPRVISHKNGWRGVSIIAAWTIVSAFSVLGVLVTQTRAIWLGLLVALLVALSCLG